MQNEPSSLSACMRAAAQGQRGAFVDDLSHMVQCESPTNDDQAFPLLFDWLTTALGPLGFHCRRHPSDEEAHVLLAAHPNGSGHQLIITHVDTVWPRGTLAEMPFIVDGNVIRGPGVFDMKGGVCMLLAALRVLRELELEPSLFPLILFSTDEETGSDRSRDIIERCAQTSRRAFVLEPALGLDGKLKSARKGIGRYHVVVEGQAAHAGLDPDGGASAILEMSHVVQTLFALNNPARGITVNVGTIDGGLRSNVIAPTASADVEIRVRTADDASSLHRAVNAITAMNSKCQIKINGGFDRPPMEATKGNMALVNRALKIANELGIPLDHGAAGGASDGNFTSQFCPTLDGLGAVGDGAHASHEHLLIEETLDRVALLAALLLEP
jgi:glutamate carboxypeptidase